MAVIPLRAPGQGLGKPLLGASRRQIMCCQSESGRPGLLRIPADDTVFAIPEVDLGIPLTWGGIPRLIRELSPAIVRELVLTCRRFDAAEARDLGFVNRVVPRGELESAVGELAASLALKAPSVLRATKRQVNAALEAVASTAGAWSEADLLGAATADPEARAAARAYLARH